MIFILLETEMDTLANRYKLCHFNRTMSPLYLVKLKIEQKRPQLTAVRSVEPIVPTFVESRSFNVRFFSSLLENSFSSLLTKKILHYHGFYQKFIFKLNMVNFNM